MNEQSKILDIIVSTSFNNEGSEIKRIRFQYGAMKIDVCLNEAQVNKLLRTLLIKGVYSLRVENFQIPLLPNNRKKYFEITKDTFNPRTMPKEYL